MEEQILEVNTPVGPIKAIPNNVNDEYPGIRIVANGLSVAYVEYDCLKHEFLICTYDDASDEPREVYCVSGKEE